ncbi:vWA domain-containing protein [Streptomyces sp. NPDC003300]|uniref:vWA domain-containing protein n=1 Tax=unclassified Streptomyces TaxID=2593676 RepID=UPI0033B2F09F
MTNADRRHIAIVLDRSGSMQKVKTDTEGGLAAFLEAQADAPGETTVSLYQFDDQYEAVYENKTLTDVPAYRLVPRGATALFDAVGRTVNAVGEQLVAQPEADRPGEVVVVILTDGQENASREFTGQSVKASVTRQQDNYGWKFVFLGADQDAFEAGGSLGIDRDSTLSYVSSNTRASMTAAGRMVSRGTASGLYAFTDAERDATA